MALDVEGVVDGSVCGKEFLGRTRALEPLHLALPPPRRLMRILNSIVLPSPPLVPAFDPKDPDCGAVRSQVVGDQSLGNEGVRPQELAHQFQRSVLFAWTGPAHRGPRLRRRQLARGRPFGRRFSDRPRRDAKSYEASGDAFVGPLRSSVRNGSPNAEPSHRTRPFRVPPTNLRRRAG